MQATVPDKCKVTCKCKQACGVCKSGCIRSIICLLKHTCIKVLINKTIPLEEADSDLICCIEVVKKFHAALSKQANAVDGFGANELLTLRKDLTGHVNDVIEELSR